MWKNGIKGEITEKQGILSVAINESNLNEGQAMNVWQINNDGSEKFLLRLPFPVASYFSFVVSGKYI